MSAIQHQWARWQVPGTMPASFTLSLWVQGWTTARLTLRLTVTDALAEPIRSLFVRASVKESFILSVIAMAVR